MSKSFTLVRPVFLVVFALALVLAAMSPAVALAFDDSEAAVEVQAKSISDEAASFDVRDFDVEGRAFEPLGEWKTLAERVEVEDDLMVLSDPESEVEADLLVLPDPWMEFPDVMHEVENAGGPKNVWYVADGWLKYVVGEGLMSGYSSSGCFGPYDNITRGQVVAILYRAECAKDPSLIEKYGSTTDPADYAKTCEFEDMKAGEYYTAAVNWAKDVGVMTGDAATGYTTVRPDDPVARQELCLMLARYANGGEAPATALDPAKAEGIKGMDQIASWARDGVYWAVNNGAIGGVDNHDGTFSMDPTRTTWRSAAAKMFTVVMRDVM